MFVSIFYRVVNWLSAKFGKEQQRAEDAQAILKAGQKERDPAKVTSAFDRLNRNKAMLLPLILFLTGCQQYVVIHSTEGHIYSVPKGTQIVTEKGIVTTEHPGWWVSDWYVDEVFKARMEQETK
jgi:hypothetical protein